MSTLDPNDTIAAVASPPGPGFRGLIRLTGPNALAIALARFSDDRGNPPFPRHPERRSGKLAVTGLRPTLPAAIALWPGPRTYTGQALAEIHTVGSPPLVNLVLADCLAQGARHAEPGEFTLRAFLSGRIDLTRAEAVLGVIDAQTPAQLDAALRQLAGGLAGPITALRNRLLDVLAHLEANLDFAEESDVDPLGRAALADDLAREGAELLALATRLQGRDRSDGHPRVVLAGPPNAGKSHLFNALLGQAHAIVSPQAGTTRDYLSALCECDGLTVELVDTAGVEPASSPIEGQAQSFGADQAARADLLLDCRSSDTSTTPSWPIAPDRPRLLVRTKSDLDPAGDSPEFLATSAATGAGLDELRRAVGAALRSRAADGDLPASTGARCRESLERAGQALRSAADTILLNGGDELVAIDLRQAVDDLGKVVGAIVTDDILDRIFRRFCIGK
ncbi:tRNA modification GTPase trmE [Singulisphaera sp. GP187]|uniref:tRNA modification GTPase n=1 Tax=Singulisphaera sp. GP187 TaxID=1882752 RepID=UPI00092A44B4|nr:tRNA modification GTPase [Singulisphaera sp. GP187]SIO45569.1 tRNA modification GTPase trmE [Singulisphaera sp. GP187]